MTKEEEAEAQRSRAQFAKLMAKQQYHWDSEQGKWYKIDPFTNNRRYWEGTEEDFHELKFYWSRKDFKRVKVHHLRSSIYYNHTFAWVIGYDAAAHRYIVIMDRDGATKLMSSSNLIWFTEYENRMALFWKKIKHTDHHPHTHNFNDKEGDKDSIHDIDHPGYRPDSAHYDTEGNLVHTPKHTTPVLLTPPMFTPPTHDIQDDRMSVGTPIPTGTMLFRETPRAEEVP